MSIYNHPRLSTKEAGKITTLGAGLCLLALTPIPVLAEHDRSYGSAEVTLGFPNGHISVGKTWGEPAPRVVVHERVETVVHQYPQNERRVVVVEEEEDRDDEVVIIKKVKRPQRKVTVIEKYYEEPEPCEQVQVVQKVYVEPRHSHRKHVVVHKHVNHGHGHKVHHRSHHRDHDKGHYRDNDHHRPGRSRGVSKHMVAVGGHRH